MDREWYEVCRNGQVLADDLNEETAYAAAQDAAEEFGIPVVVVRCRRTEVRRYQREVTVTSQNMEA